MKLLILGLFSMIFVACGNNSSELNTITKQKLYDCQGADYHIEIYKLFDGAYGTVETGLHETKQGWIPPETDLSQPIRVIINGQFLMLNIATMCYNSQ